MTQVDFYLLSSQEVNLRLRYACILAEQEYKQGKTVFIYTSSDKDSSALDKMLWSFRDNSFIPHDIANNDNNPVAPIIIANAPSIPSTDEVLINLSDSVPNFFSRFHFVKEIVIENDDIKTLTRQNFRYYKERGYPLQHYKINADTI